MFALAVRFLNQVALFMVFLFLNAILCFSFLSTGIVALACAFARPRSDWGQFRALAGTRAGS